MCLLVSPYCHTRTASVCPTSTYQKNSRLLLRQTIICFHIQLHRDNSQHASSLSFVCFQWFLFQLNLSHLWQIILRYCQTVLSFQHMFEWHLFCFITSVKVLSLPFFLTQNNTDTLLHILCPYAANWPLFQPKRKCVSTLRPPHREMITRLYPHGYRKKTLHYCATHTHAQCSNITPVVVSYATHQQMLLLFQNLWLCDDRPLIYIYLLSL